MDRKIEQLTAREIREAIKKGLGMSHFCDRYGCSEDDIAKRVGQLYNRGTGEEKDKVLSSLRKNDKKPANKRAGRKSKDTSAEKASQVAQEKGPEDALENLSLEEIKIEEKKLSDRLMELESLQKEHFLEKRRIPEKMAEIKEKIEDVNTSLRKMQRCFEEYVSEDATLTEQINKTSDEYDEKRARILEIRERKSLAKWLSTFMTMALSSRKARRF